MPATTVQQFIDAINAHDVKRIMALQTSDFEFVDALNHSQKGAAMEAGWRAYFSWFPDYKIEVEKMMSDGDEVAVFGFASGTYHQLKDSAAHWRLPAAWRARVRASRIERWQVFTDTGLPFQIISRYTQPSDSTQAVTGFGGVFFKSPDAKALASWYDKHLGTQFGKQGYMLFNWRERENKEHIGSTTFGLFKNTTDYFEPSKASFMLNFRVRDLDAMLAKLKSEGVTVVGEPVTYDYGKFGWIMDADNNKIELWQPMNESILDK